MYGKLIKSLLMNHVLSVERIDYILPPTVALFTLYCMPMYNLLALTMCIGIYNLEHVNYAHSRRAHDIYR